MPIDMRVGKLRGNTSADAMPIGPFRTYIQPVNVGSLEERFDAGAEVTPEALKAAGLIAKLSVDVKVLGEGELTKKLSVTAHSFSKLGGREDRGRGRDRHAAPRAGRAQEEEAQGGRAGRRDRRAGDRRRGDRAGGGAGGGRGRRADGGRGVTHVLLARERLAGSGAPPARPLHGDDPRGLPPRLVDSRAGRRLADDRGLLLGRGRHDPRPAQPLLGRRALAVLPLRARDHAVRHGVDHRPADDRRHPAARRAAAGGRGGLREDHAVHALPHGRARRRAGDGLRVPVPQPGRARRRLGRARPHHRLADRRHRPPHVDGRAHHEARHRQRHLDPHLRVDPRRRCRSASPPGGTAARWRSSSSR